MPQSELRLGLLTGFAMLAAGIWLVARHTADESGRTLIDHFLDAGPGH